MLSCYLEPAFAGIPTMLANAPRLAHLRVCNIPRVVLFQPTVLSNLTELYLNTRDLDMYMLMAALAPCSDSLVTLTLSSCRFFIRENQVPTAFQFTSLRTLILEDVVDKDDDEVPSPSLEFLFHRVKDSITTLRLGGDEFAARTLEDPDVRFLMAFVHTLQYYDMAGAVDDDVENSSRLFFTVPYIQVLQASDVDISLRLRHAIEVNNRYRPEGNGIAVWPSLHTLILSEVQEDALLAFIEYRAASARPLRTLILGDLSLLGFATETLERFRVLGLEVRRVSEMPLEIRQSMQPSPVFMPWDNDLGRPDFRPWDGSWAFEDES